MRLLLTLPLLAISAYCLESGLLSSAERRTRIPLVLLTNFEKPTISIRTPDFQLLSEGADSSLQGNDKSGHPWGVNLRAAVHNAWKGPPASYYFDGYTGATGMGPMTWILALSFDEQHRPVPFFIMTHGSIADLVNLDRTGPQLLQQDYQGNIRDDPGYYVTTLYQRRGPYWIRSDGRHGEHVFPTSEKWSVEWSDKPAVAMLPPVFKRAVQDSSNDPSAGLKAKIVSLGAYDNVNLNPNSGCTSVKPEVLVRDTAGGRQIEMEEFKEDLTQLATMHANVSLTGVSHWPNDGSCSASILWASN